MTAKDIFNQQIDLLKEKGRYREVYDSTHYTANMVEKQGRQLISFSCNDYLGLSHNKQIIKAAQKAIETYGTGGTASRLITGNNILYSKLEAEIAATHKTEAATIFTSGYAANIGAIPVIAEKGDLILLDKLAHSCLLEGAKLSDAEVKRFKHNDHDNLSKLLQKSHKKYKKCIIITEAVFSMDGDRADISQLRKLAKKYNALLYIDYAHDIEIFTENKKQITHNYEIKMGTFSKALAGQGGYIGGSKALIKLINSKAKSLIFSTALPPATLAGNLKALQIANSKPHLAEKALDNAKYFTQQIKKLIPVSCFLSPDSQIIPMIIGDTAKTIKLSKHLEEQGFLVHPIKPPTVPENTSRLRFSFSASHAEKQITHLADCLKSLL